MDFFLNTTLAFGRGVQVMLGSTHIKNCLNLGIAQKGGGSMLEVNVKPTTQTGFNLKLGYNDVTIVNLI